MSNRPKANVITTYARDNLEIKGYLGERVVKGLAFVLLEVLKVKNYSIEIVPPGDVRGTIIIHVYDADNKEVFMRPKPAIMEILVGFINVSQFYNIEFARG